MTLNYSLTENDYLQQQLYLASKSELVKKQRKTARVLVFVILLIIGFLFYMNKNIFLASYFGVSSIMCFFLFPFYLKKYYQRIFKKYVHQNFRSRIDITSTVFFNEHALEILNEGIGDSKINFSNFKNISEIEKYFFIAFKTGGNLMISKSEIEDIEALRVKLKAIAEKMNIDFISELDWKWK